MKATIHNEFLTLTVDTHGAEAVSLKNAAGQEMLWQADPAVWKRHAPILFPWTGKLTGGAFTHKGKTYPGGQHGFARDVEHTLLCAEGDTIRLELRSDEKSKAERFPFDFVLTSTFRLEGRTVHHTLTVTNPADAAEELQFGIGYHPAFRIPFDDKHSTTDYEFRFDQPESPMILDAYPNGLLTGKCGYRWKNEQSIPLTDDLFENDSFCMAGLRSRTLGIYEKDTGKGIVHIADDSLAGVFLARWASTRKTPARESSAMWRATPTPSSGRLRQSLCALSALSRGTPCPVPRPIPRSGASAPLPPALPPARPGRPPSAQRLSAEAKFGKEMQEPLDRGDCILI